jgi:hypothetical protein
VAVAVLAALYDTRILRRAKLRQRLPRLLAEGLTALGRVYAVQPHPDVLFVDQDRERVAVGYLDHAAGEVGERSARRERKNS